MTHTGPAHTAPGQPALTPAADSTHGSISCTSAGSAACQGPPGHRAGSAAAATAASSIAVHGELNASAISTCDQHAQPPHDPGVLTIVHVLRPNQPAVAEAAPAAADCADGGLGLGGACGSNSRPASPGPGVECRASSGSSRPGSSGKVLGKQAVGRAAAAASGMDSITSLDAGEMLEMLLLVSVLCNVLRALHWANCRSQCCTFAACSPAVVAPASCKQPWTTLPRGFIQHYVMKCC